MPFATAVPAGSPASEAASAAVWPGPIKAGPAEPAEGDLSPLPAGASADLDPQQERNVDVAERLLALSEDTGPPLQRALTQAQVVSHWQADSLDVTWEDEDLAGDHDRPSQAVFALLERHEVSLTADERADVRALDELPADVATELADVVDAFLGLQTATGQAYADADRAVVAEPTLGHSLEPGTEAAEFSLAEAGVDLAPVFPARSQLLEEIGQLDRAVEANPALAAGSGPVVNVPPAVAIDAPGSDTTYTDDVALLVDLGGNDTYHNNAGGSGLTNPPGTSTSVVTEDPCRFPGFEFPGGIHTTATLVDLGEADDGYGDPDAFGSCGRNGGGDRGTGLLVDDGGDDTYSVGNDESVGGCFACGPGSFGVNGASNLGLGALVDAGGHDVYRAGTNTTVTHCPDSNCMGGSMSVNGGSRGAAGLIVDGGAGDDVYDAGSGSTIESCSAGDCFAAGGGINGGNDLAGTGALVDNGGDDLYQAGRDVTIDCPGDCTIGGVGVNGGGNAGRSGLLVDAGGNDTYSAAAESTVAFCGAFGCQMAAFAINGGAAAGTGGLFDAGGDDVYRTAPGFTVQECEANCRVGGDGVNGGAATGGSAQLVDLGGDDVYRAGTDVTVPACPQACGIAHLGANGGAGVAGVARLVDAGGDDVYQAGTGSVCLPNCPVAELGTNGGGNAGLGLLFDGGGTDEYDDNASGSGTDQTVVPKALVGAQIDASLT